MFQTPKFSTGYILVYLATLSQVIISFFTNINISHKALIFNATRTNTFSFSDDKSGGWADAKSFNQQASLSDQCAVYFGFQASFMPLFE